MRLIRLLKDFQEADRFVVITISDGQQNLAEQALDQRYTLVTPS